MKFLKLKLVNFKPYYGSSEIKFFEKNRKEQSMTLNIGPTGHGKTTISESIMWCLFGESYKPEWKEWVNDLSQEIAKEKKENEVKMIVELTAEINNNIYKIIRSGKFDIRERVKKRDSEVSILKDGEPIREDPIKFINKHFLPVDLMRYFIFDADDILRLFEENRENTIKDHINKIVGVEKLDNMIEALDKVIDSYGRDIEEIESGIKEEIVGKIKEKRKNVQKKEKAISELNGEIKKWGNGKKDIFPRSPSGRVKRFSDLVDERDGLETEINDLNKEFKNKMFENKKLISKIHLLFLKDHIDKSLDKLEKEEVTKSDFEASVAIIKSAVERNYSGIVFSGEENALIKDATKIGRKNLEDINKLNLVEGGSEIKTDEIKVFDKYKKQIENLSGLFSDFKNKIDKKLNALLEVRNKIRQIGDTEKNKELKRKFNLFNKLEKNIEENRNRIEEIVEAKEDLKGEIGELTEELHLSQEQEKKIKSRKDKQEKTKILLEIVKTTRAEFLKDLLSEVNKNSSKFLRETVKDVKRFYSIEVNSDYQLNIKQKNGQILPEAAINRGSLQIALMSFFFGLSNYLGRDIPYVIDDPLIRLDPGHDKRLLTQLAKSKSQLIMHLIPGKEYTPESFKWLKFHTNVQNWIYREKYRTFDMNRSYVKAVNPGQMIEYDIDKF